jgi:hypothetical protein
VEINEYIIRIKELGACGEAVKNALDYKTSQELWDNCERGDWMLWLIGKLSGESESEKRKGLVLAACECARLMLKLVAKGETRPLKAIETAEKWAKGKATIQEVRADAADAADAANTAYAANAANAAAYAAYAAYAAAYAAYAAYAANAAYAAYAWQSTLKQCAAIVREYYPNVDGLF